MKCKYCKGTKKTKTCGLKDLKKEDKDIIWEIHDCPICRGTGKISLGAWIELKRWGI